MKSANTNREFEQSRAKFSLDEWQAITTKTQPCTHTKQRERGLCSDSLLRHVEFSLLFRHFWRRRPRRLLLNPRRTKRHESSNGLQRRICAEYFPSSVFYMFADGFCRCFLPFDCRAISFCDVEKCFVLSEARRENRASCHKNSIELNKVLKLKY